MKNRDILLLLNRDNEQMMYYLNEITNKWLNRYSRNTEMKSKTYRTIGTIPNSNIKTVERDGRDNWQKENEVFLQDFHGNNISVVGISVPLILK